MPLLLADRWAEIVRWFNSYEAPEKWILCILVQFHLGTHLLYQGPWKGPRLNHCNPRALRAHLLNTALLLALASVKRIWDLQALSINPACLEFGPKDSKVILKPRLGYVPKVLSTPFRIQVITLPRFLPRRVARNCPWSASSGPWGYTWSILPHTGNQNSFGNCDKVALLRSKTFLGG